jgi:hypothetical protein
LGSSDGVNMQWAQHATCAEILRRSPTVSRDRAPGPFLSRNLAKSCVLRPSSSFIDFATPSSHLQVILVPTQILLSAPGDSSNIPFSMSRHVVALLCVPCAVCVVCVRTALTIFVGVLAGAHKMDRFLFGARCMVTLCSVVLLALPLCLAQPTDSGEETVCIDLGSAHNDSGGFDPALFCCLQEATRMWWRCRRLKSSVGCVSHTHRALRAAHCAVA